MKNLISERVADFIKNFPPFNILDTTSLHALSEQVLIVYKEKNSIIFTVDENQLVAECLIEAVISNNVYAINWRDLKNNQHWKMGWQ
mgnify:CR=1 FL=1